MCSGLGLREALKSIEERKGKLVYTQEIRDFIKLSRGATIQGRNSRSNGEVSLT